MAAATTATAIPPPFFSPYLDDQSGKIQAKGVPWEVRVMSSSVDNLSTDH
jgi:V-type H+-transporting ATPase subunit H